MPPSHGHRIQFKLYALDDELHLGNKVGSFAHACVYECLMLKFCWERAKYMYFLNCV